MHLEGEATSHADGEAEMGLGKRVVRVSAAEQAAAPELSGSSWGCSDMFPAGLTPGVFPVAQEGAVSTPSTDARALGLMNLWQRWKKSHLNPAPLTLSPSRNGLDWALSLLEMPSPWPSQTSECVGKDRTGTGAPVLGREGCCGCARPQMSTAHE